jgi:hypothetical protein
MGKSIIELFESNRVSRQIPQEKPKSGTPQEGQFLIDRNNRVGNFFGNALGTSDPLRETAFEQETTGLRVRRFVNQTALYGTDLIRITTKSTDVVNAFKAARTNEGNVNLIQLFEPNNLSTKINNFLGIPKTIYPSALRANPKFVEEAAPRKLDTLAEIRKDAAGSLIGRYLRDTGTGTPQQASKRVIGGGLTLAKGVVRDALIGKERVVPITTGSLDGFVTKYYHKNTYQGSMEALIQPDSKQQLDITLVSPISGLERKDGKFGQLRFANKSVYGLTLSDGSANQKFGEPTIKDLTEKYNSPIKPYTSGSAALVEGKLKNNKLLDFLKPTALKQKQITRYSKDTSKKSIHNKDTVSNNELGKRRGLYTDRDILNQTGRFTESELQTTKINGTDISEVDLIPLRFQKVNDGSAVYVRSLVTGFNETFSPSWDASRMLGHPFNFYNFTNVERKLTFNFKSYAMSQPELVLMWRRLEFISHCTYPDSYTGSGIFQPTLIYFTFGNLYIDKVCFIDSLSYTIDDAENLWELGGDKIKTKAGRFVDFNNKFSVGANNSSNVLSIAGTRKSVDRNLPDVPTTNELYDKGTNSSTIKRDDRKIEYNSGDLNMDHYKLPKIVNASIGLTFIESRNTTQTNLYGYGKPISKSANKNTI